MTVVEFLNLYQILGEEIYSTIWLCRILMHGGDRRSFQKYLKHFVGYAELSDVPESDMTDTTVRAQNGRNTSI